MSANNKMLSAIYLIVLIVSSVIAEQVETKVAEFKCFNKWESQTTPKKEPKAEKCGETQHRCLKTFKTKDGKTLDWQGKCATEYECSYRLNECFVRPDKEDTACCCDTSECLNNYNHSTTTNVSISMIVLSMVLSWFMLDKH